MTPVNHDWWFAGRFSAACARLAGLTLIVSLSACGGNSAGAVNSDRDPTNSSSLTFGPATGFTSFVYPLPGQISVDSTRTFEWVPVANATYYQLQLGSTREGSDIFDSGAIPGTSVTVSNLPTSGVVYARVRLIPQGWSTKAPAGRFPRATYATFNIDANVTGAAITAPAAGATLDADTPMQWQADPLATGYRLTLSNAADGAVLLDTGVIHGTLRVVPDLPSGTAISATLVTYYSQNTSRSHTLSFIAGNPSVSVPGMLAVARTLTANVRLMADIDNQPYDGAPLYARSLSAGQGAADCVAFSQTLLDSFDDAGLPLQARARGTCYNLPNCHELVEVLDSDQSRWITLDPTFGLYTVNASGQAASAEEISAAVREQSFGSLSFVFLTPAAEAYAAGYYLDYPLLFMDLYTAGGTSSFEQPAPASLEPFLDLIGSATDSPVSGFYTIQCASGSTSATANWDGSVRTYPCTNGYTQIFWGIKVSLLPGDGSAAAIWRPHRFVF